MDNLWKRHRPRTGPGGVKCPCCGPDHSKVEDRRTTRTRLKRELFRLLREPEDRRIASAA